MADEQLDIFGGAVPFADLEGRTSRAGGRGGSAEASTIPDDPWRYAAILTVLGSHSWVLPDNVVRPDPPLADWEIAKRMPDVHPGTVSKRRLRLERAGLVEEVPGVMHPTPYKVEAMTFTITDKGREVLKQWQSQQQSNPNGPTPPTSAGTSSSSTPSG
jgi:hypothetical protein